MGRSSSRIRVDVMDEAGPRTVLVSSEQVLANPVMLAQTVRRIEQEMGKCTRELLSLDADGAGRLWRQLPQALRASWGLDARNENA